LLFANKKKLYLSYPITLLRNTPEKIEQIRAIGALLTKSFIVFDPLDIKDMEFLANLEKGDSGAKIGDLDKGMIERIKTRTISRDYQFIRQSDFVVVVYPMDKLSPGVLSEMNFASRYNKPVYAVYNHARSIFFENLCEQIFNSPEEMEKFLLETYATESTT
jgi:nucleoside 2-deoxyribosyltransferase